MLVLLVSLGETIAGGPTGLAITLSIKGYVGLANMIGVPIREATKTIDNADLRRVFGGKTADQRKAEIAALPTEPRLASWTIKKIFGGQAQLKASRSGIGEDLKRAAIAFVDREAGKVAGSAPSMTRHGEAGCAARIVQSTARRMIVVEPASQAG